MSSMGTNLTGQIFCSSKALEAGSQLSDGVDSLTAERASTPDESLAVAESATADQDRAAGQSEVGGSSRRLPALKVAFEDEDGEQPSGALPPSEIQPDVHPTGGNYCKDTFSEPSHKTLL